MRIDNIDKKVSEPIVQKPRVSGQDVPIFKTGKAKKTEEITLPMEKEHFSNAEIFRSVEKANEKVMNRNTELHFSIHEKTKQIMIKVMNTETQEVVREIPSEKILDMVANFMEIAGLYIDKKA